MASEGEVRTREMLGGGGPPSVQILEGFEGTKILVLDCLDAGHFYLNFIQIQILQNIKQTHKWQTLGCWK